MNAARLNYMAKPVKHEAFKDSLVISDTSHCLLAGYRNEILYFNYFRKEEFIEPVLSNFRGNQNLDGEKYTFKNLIC